MNQKQFTESFIISFCSTVYKYQGGTIDQHYNIYMIVNAWIKNSFIHH